MPVGTGHLHALLSRQHLRLHKDDAKADIGESTAPLDIFTATLRHDITAGAYYTRQAIVPATRTSDFFFGTHGNALPPPRGEDARLYVRQAGVVGVFATSLSNVAGAFGGKWGVVVALPVTGGISQLSALVGAVPKAVGSALGASGGVLVGLPHATIAACQQRLSPRAPIIRAPLALGDNVFTAILTHCIGLIGSDPEKMALLRFLQAMNGPAGRYCMTDERGNPGPYLEPGPEDRTMKDFVRRTVGKPQGIFQITFENGGQQTIHGECTTPAIFIPESVAAFESAMTEALAPGLRSRNFRDLKKLLASLGHGCYDAKVNELNNYLQQKAGVHIENDDAFNYNFDGKETDIDRAAEIARVVRLKALLACRRSLGVPRREEDEDVAARPEFAQRFFNRVVVAEALKANGIFDKRSDDEFNEVMRQLDEELVMFG